MTRFLQRRSYSVLLGILAASFLGGPLTASQTEDTDYVTIAILAKDKAHTLPLYLSCIERQTWPKKRTYLYIRTNNNNDNTLEMLQDWIRKVGSQYAAVYFDSRDVTEDVQKYKQHEWNAHRFRVLGKIRQESIEWADAKNSHYFVVDCDNFIQPNTIEKLFESNLPIVAPLLRVAEPSCYANYHFAIDQNGYYAHNPHYYSVLSREVQGLIEVPVVHCSYLIRQPELKKIKYDDGSYRYEYVIFSDNARRNQISQYLDNRELFGRISFAETAEELAREPWLYEFDNTKDKAAAIFTSIYDNAVWARNKEGKGTSGEGSTEQNTQAYRNFLQKFLQDYQISSVVDAGCGDWEFSRYIDWSGIDYKGYDVVKSVVDSNNERYANSSTQFIHGNFTTLDLPPADLFICKDVFQHLPNASITPFLDQLKKYKYCLITNDVNPNTLSGENFDTPIGGYRNFDLSQAPFNVSGEKAFFFDAGLVKKSVFLIKN